MALAAAFDLETIQLDVVNAFPSVPLNEDIFCFPPPGMDLPPGKCLQLLRALYGLKQSPALWQNHFTQSLLDLGLLSVPDAPCLFTNEFLILFFFVDDIILMFSRQHRQYVMSFQEELSQRYEMRVLGEIQWFLSIRVIRNRQERTLWLS